MTIGVSGKGVESVCEFNCCSETKSKAVLGILDDWVRNGIVGCSGFDNGRALFCRCCDCFEELGGGGEGDTGSEGRT